MQGFRNSNPPVVTGICDQVNLDHDTIANGVLISITDVLQMSLLRKLVVIVVSSNKVWKIDLMNSVEFVVQKVLQ